MSVTRPLYNATANGNVEFTEAEYAEYEASLPQVEVSYQEHLERTVRAERDSKLAETDWTQVADYAKTDRHREAMQVWEECGRNNARAANNLKVRVV